MVNNFDIINNFLFFESEDCFYFLQIIQRKKDGPDNINRAVKTYYITSKKHLQELWDEIVLLCNFYNARAYINLNVKSFKKVGTSSLKKTADYIYEEKYKAIRNVYNSACQESSSSNKVWVVDIDDTYDKAEEVGNFIYSIHDVPYIMCLPTVAGFHLITKPFCTDIFYEKYKNISVHKEGMTLLYYGDKINE